MKSNDLLKWIAKNPYKSLIVLLLVFWSLNQLMPLFWMYMMSLKPDLEIVRHPFSFYFPPLWQNYSDAWTGKATEVTLNLYFINTGIVVAVGLIILVVIATMAGYSFGRFDFPGRRILFLFMIALIAVPMHALIVPLYYQFRAYGLINRLLGLILLNVTSTLPFSILMLQAYFSTFPSELEDAAMIDGCNRLGTFFRIVVPISKGAISAVAIVNFIGMWNEVLLALIILWENSKRTLAVGLLGYMAQWGEIRWGLIFAGLSIVTLPLIGFYILFQKNIIKGATLGSYR